MIRARIVEEHETAATYALQARYWFITGRLAKSDGSLLLAAHSVLAWQRKWDTAERHSDQAERLEIKHGPILPGAER